MYSTLARYSRLNTCLITIHLHGALKPKHSLVITRSFWKLNKKVLKEPLPPLPEDLQAAEQSTQTQPTQAQPTTIPPTQAAHKNINSKQQPQIIPKPTFSSPVARLTIPKDNIVYTHEQKWFFRMFGMGVAAQFGAWIFFLDLVGRNPKISYSLSFPVFGMIVGSFFAYFARELAMHNVRELKLFPGGRAIEIVTYTLFGFRNTEILAIDRIP